MYICFPKERLKSVERKIDLKISCLILALMVVHWKENNTRLQGRNMVVMCSLA